MGLRPWGPVGDGIKNSVEPSSRQRQTKEIEKKISTRQNLKIYARQGHVIEPSDRVTTKQCWGVYTINWNCFRFPTIGLFSKKERSLNKIRSIHFDDWSARRASQHFQLLKNERKIKSSRDQSIDENVDSRKHESTTVSWLGVEQLLERFRHFSPLSRRKKRK